MNAEETPSKPLELKRTLGAWRLVSLGIGAVIGAGLFSLTGMAASDHAGPAVVLSFIFAGVGCALVGLCYAECASMIPKAGSAYSFAREALSPWLAWVIGWDLILEYCIGASTVAVSFCGYFVSLLGDWGIHLPAQLVASPFEHLKLPDGSYVHATGWLNLPAAALIIVISFLLIRGVEESASVTSVLVVLKVAVVVIFIVLGLQFTNPALRHPLIPPNDGTFGQFGWSGVLAGAGVIFFAFIGFDAVSTAAQETKNPQRNVPIGILGSLAICTLLYVLFSFVLTGLVPYQVFGTDANRDAPVVVAMQAIPKYLWLRPMIKVAVMLGYTSVILVMLMGQSRLFFAMAEDKLLPKIFSDLHPKFKTPWRSNLVLMIFAATFAAFTPMGKLGEMTSIGTLFAFCIVAASVIRLRKTRPHWERPFRTPAVPFIPLLGIGACLVMMIHLGIGNWLRLLVWFALGQAVYFVYARRQTTVRSVTAPATPQTVRTE